MVIKVDVQMRGAKLTHTHTHTATELQQPLTININHLTYSPSYKSALSDCVDYTEYV